MSLFYLPQFKQVNLVAPAGITAVQTSGIKLSNVDGIDKTKPGIICLTWALALDTSVAEWATYTSIDANDELVGVIRGAEGFSAKEHLSNAVIAWSYSKSHINNLNDAFLTEHNEDGTHKAMTSPIFITPKIKDTSSDHDYIFAVSELTANRTITLPLLTGNDEFVFKDHTQTLQNKRINCRTVTAASYTTDTGTALDVATCDVFQVTAQAGALKLNNPSGTPLANQKLIVRIKDNGTARALTYDTQFRASSDLALPTTTIINKTIYLGFIFNATDTKWDLLAYSDNI